MIRDVVESFRAGTAPRETFRDGLVVNSIIDAAYRSMRTGRWEPVESVEAVEAPLAGAAVGR